MNTLRRGQVSKREREKESAEGEFIVETLLLVVLEAVVLQVEQSFPEGKHALSHLSVNVDQVPLGLHELEFLQVEVVLR